MNQQHSLRRVVAPLVVKKALGFVVLTFVGVAVALGGIASGLLEEFEASSWDMRLRSTPRPVPDARVQVIAIDQASLNFRAAQDSALTWPWPREMYVPLIKFAEMSKARGIAFDLLFTEQARNGVADDEIFGAAIRESTIPVVLAAQPTNDRASSSRPEVVRAALETVAPRSSGEQEWRQRMVDATTASRFASLQAPVAELLTGRASIGSVMGVQDGDGVFRRAVPGVRVGERTLLSLPFALFERATPEPLPQMSTTAPYVVNFSAGTKSYSTFSYDAIIQSYLDVQEGRTPLVSLTQFKDAYLFVGAFAPGILDLRPTPVDPKAPGVMLNATILDNLLQQRFVSRPSLLKVALVVSGAVMLAVGALLFVPHGLLSAFAVCMVAIVYGSGTFWYAAGGVWFPLVWPSVGILFSVLGGLALQYQLEGRAHRFVRNAFRHYVSESVIDELTRDPSQLALGGARRELTLFFSDIEGFTSISERLDPSALVGLLNTFLSEMSDLIMREGGTVDKYVGDAIVAFWNAPLEVPDHASRAVRAALACQARVSALQVKFQQEYGVRVAMRIGIHTGVVSVGNFGSSRRFNYTVIGDAANLASRLEGANKAFHTMVLISEATARALKGGGWHMRELGDIRVVGKQEAITVYEPRLTPSPARFDEALQHFRAGARAEARSIFAELSEDGPSKAYVARIDREANGDDAVWKLTEK